MNESLLLLPFAAVPVWLVSWLTTLWLLSVGVALALLTLLVVWGLLFVVWRSAAREVPIVLGEGPMPLLTGLAVVVALFAPAGMLIVREPVAMLKSVARLPMIHDRSIPATIETQGDTQPVALGVRGDEIKALEVTSDELVEMVDALKEEERQVPPAEIGPSRSFKWLRAQQNSPLLGGGVIDQLYFTNLSGRPASVTIKIDAQSAYPEVSAVPMTAISVLGLFVLYFVQAWGFPKISAVALAATKSEMAQPLFWILLALGVFFLLLFIFLPYNTFGEDIKMLKDSSLTLIMVLGIIQGVWAASNSVADEIEGRTALTVLSKPVSRRQFIIGKIIGILWTVAIIFVVLGLWLLMIVAYKPIYDARELGAEEPEWTLAHMEVVRTVPGLVLGFFEATVLVSLSVAISTRLPMLANFVICFSIYVLGHITPLIVQSSIQFAPVVFAGQFIATILPVLDHFNIQAAVAAGREVPLNYVSWAFAYCVLYSLIALLLALVLFEDRDLA